MNKLNAARLRANDFPEHIFLWKKVPERDGMGVRRIDRWLANQPGGVGDGSCGGVPPWLTASFRGDIADYRGVRRGS
ncbi:hypothetical protein LGN19_13955 [Burkholderia sp. AU30198]|uniref:hypothetical protein n=1 Tax=Burkholderia sp. AU30198 TaxID=2879627 RepID=UPI001CF1A442|nr:hypothetical protein [Burkholderia sp. AU30198]MCA8294896.1 hypothetical protein [Burkholderia sp. AU30198]